MRKNRWRGKRINSSGLAPPPMPETSRFRLVLPGPALSLAVAADGSTIVAGDRNGNLTVSDGEGALLWQRKLGEGIHGVAVSRDGQRIVCGRKDG